jgi:hypothetical protein
MRGGFSFKTLEKLGYLIGVPILVGYSGFVLYKNALI